MDNNICVPLYSLWYFQNLLKCPQNNLAGIAIEAGKTLLEKNKYIYVQFSSVAQSCPTLRPHESQQAMPPFSSPTPRVHSDSGPSSQ